MPVGMLIVLTIPTKQLGFHIQEIISIVCTPQDNPSHIYNFGLDLFRETVRSTHLLNQVCMQPADWGNQWTENLRDYFWIHVTH